MSLRVSPLRPPWRPPTPDPAADVAPRVRVPRRDRAPIGAVVSALVLVALAAIAWFALAEVLRAIESSAAAVLEWENGARRGLIVTALLAAALLTLIVSWGRSTAPGRPVRLAGGRGTMTVDEIAGHVRAAIVARPQVRDATVQVENRHRAGVRVEAQVLVESNARIDATLDAIDEVSERLIEGQLGVVLDGAPLVEVRYDELDLRRSRAEDAA